VGEHTNVPFFFGVFVFVFFYYADDESVENVVTELGHTVLAEIVDRGIVQGSFGHDEGGNLEPIGTKGGFDIVEDENCGVRTVFGWLDETIVASCDGFVAVAAFVCKTFVVDIVFYQTVAERASSKSEAESGGLMTIETVVVDEATVTVGTQLGGEGWIDADWDVGVAFALLTLGFTSVFLFINVALDTESAIILCAHEPLQCGDYVEMVV
jgi:hypothetical protein